MIRGDSVRCYNGENNKEALLSSQVVLMMAKIHIPKCCVICVLRVYVFLLSASYDKTPNVESSWSSEVLSVPLEHRV